MTMADTVAVFYALDADLRELKMHPQVRELGQPAVVGTRSIHRLALGPHRIYAVKMGSGSVETAISAQALLSQFRCDWAFSIGPAGALDDSLVVGRWYRVERVVAWQSGTTSPAGFQLNPRASHEFDWDKFPVSEENIADIPLIPLASGEAFIASDSERARLRHLADASAVDMNTSGLAMVCDDHRVPLFVWRVISDGADEVASSAFRAFIDSYGGEGGNLLAECISLLPPNPNAPESYPAIMELLSGDPQQGLSPDQK